MANGIDRQFVVRNLDTGEVFAPSAFGIGPPDGVASCPPATDEDVVTFRRLFATFGPDERLYHGNRTRLQHGNGSDSAASGFMPAVGIACLVPWPESQEATCRDHVHIEYALVIRRRKLAKKTSQGTVPVPVVSVFASSSPSKH